MRKWKEVETLSLSTVGVSIPSVGSLSIPGVGIIKSEQCQKLSVHSNCLKRSHFTDKEKLGINCLF
ncbi:MAG: hypothetical protein UT19_C0004G0104 [Candidatus Woesebacteria bacterium GW2011_GWB1_39_10b]|uniref:Uncharacterized protein n=1 Tax=Candidatus Woesebacteria bacterium GW2011_GWB1_39_10b TaxID=1618573 RepID=A0A0G0LQJ2_9BACT|nr:MAG: hypothetical protein UT19_C0004G0104 [Candidatus Woesebacteria bacterium GW2011_GWB1_39_10b]